jgi:hypothetical protein
VFLAVLAPRKLLFTALGRQVSIIAQTRPRPRYDVGLLGIFPEYGPTAAPLLSHLGHEYPAMLGLWPGFASRATSHLASSPRQKDNNHAPFPTLDVSLVCPVRPCSIRNKCWSTANGMANGLLSRSFVD